MAPRRLKHPNGLESASQAEEAFKHYLEAEPILPIFPLFPDELKLRIFELAVRPRALVLPSRNRDPGYSRRQMRELYRNMNTIPSLLRVSSISRQAVRQQYTMMFNHDLDEAYLTDSEPSQEDNPADTSPQGNDASQPARTPQRPHRSVETGKCSSGLLVNLDQDIIFLEPCLPLCRAVHCCRRMFLEQDRRAVTRLGVQMETVHRLETSERIWQRLHMSWPNVRVLYMVKAWEERRYYPGLPVPQYPRSEDDEQEGSADGDGEEEGATTTAETGENEPVAATSTLDGNGTHENVASDPSSTYSNAAAPDDSSANDSDLPAPSTCFPVLKLDPNPIDLADRVLADFADMDPTEYREDIWDSGYQEWAVARAAEDATCERVRAAFERWKASTTTSTSSTTSTTAATTAGATPSPSSVQELVFVVMLRDRRPIPGQPMGAQYDRVLRCYRETGTASDMIIG